MSVSKDHQASHNSTQSNSAGKNAPEVMDSIHNISLSIFYFILLLILCVIIINILKSVSKQRCYLPESIIFVFTGACMGLILILVKRVHPNLELNSVTPTFIFVVLVPPIIFESGYNIHKKYFLENLGSIIIFAIFGTLISCIVVSTGIYICGYFSLTMTFTLRECFAFGALISAIDPVATLAVFSALHVDKVLYMLVFGESVLNDAVSISLMNTAITISTDMTNEFTVIGNAVLRFIVEFIGSALIGIALVMASSLLLKIINLRKTPALELVVVLLCSYAPYCLADALKLSGICALLFAGITMSQYTQLNLSPITKITAQQTFRTISFIAEAALFIYLGLAIFIFNHNFQITMVLWTVFFCLLGRILNIFPLSFILNCFRRQKISLSSQFMMWFSGLRGAIAFALSLMLDLEEEKHRCIVTTTLTVVLITIVILGGTSIPLVNIINNFNDIDDRLRRRKAGTEEVHDLFVDWAKIEENMKATSAHEEEPQVSKASDLIMWVNSEYLVPIFTHCFSSKEMHDSWRHMTGLMGDWYTSVRTSPVIEIEGEPDDADESEQLLAPDLSEHVSKSEYRVNIGGYNATSGLKSEIHFVQPIRNKKHKRYN